MYIYIYIHTYEYYRDRSTSSDSYSDIVRSDLIQVIRQAGDHPRVRSIPGTDEALRSAAQRHAALLWDGGGAASRRGQKHVKKE